MTSTISGPDTLAASATAPVTPAAPAAQPSLSPSRASDFMTCPLLYRFRVIDKLPERPSAAAARGTVVHAVLERLFDLPAAQRTPERARGMVEGEWSRLLEAEPRLRELFTAGLASVDVEDADAPARLPAEVPAESAESAEANGAGPEFTGPEFTAWLAEIASLLERYFALEDPRRLEPAERELYVETVLSSGLALRGYVDRLDVAPTGEMRVVDYKTGRAPGVGFEARAMFQMRFYALVLWRLHGRVPRLLQLLYLGSGEVLRYEPDEADLRSTERKLTALWAAIERATDRGEWRASPGRLCQWCDHQARCPAFGGTPPPLPVRGADPNGPGRGQVAAVTPTGPVEDPSAATGQNVSTMPSRPNP
jgi:putative RecB family exonuclease